MRPSISDDARYAHESAPVKMQAGTGVSFFIYSSERESRGRGRERGYEIASGRGRMGDMLK